MSSQRRSSRFTYNAQTGQGRPDYTVEPAEPPVIHSNNHKDVITPLDCKQYAEEWTLTPYGNRNPVTKLHFPYFTGKSVKFECILKNNRRVQAEAYILFSYPSAIPAITSFVNSNMNHPTVTPSQREKIIKYLSSPPIRTPIDKSVAVKSIIKIKDCDSYVSSRFGDYAMVISIAKEENEYYSLHKKHQTYKVMHISSNEKDPYLERNHRFEKENTEGWVTRGSFDVLLGGEEVAKCHSKEKAWLKAKHVDQSAMLEDLQERLDVESIAPCTFPFFSFFVRSTRSPPPLLPPPFFVRSHTPHVLRRTIDPLAP